MRMMDKQQEKEKYEEIIRFLGEIYACPLGRQIKYKENKDEY